MTLYEDFLVRHGVTPGEWLAAWCAGKLDHLLRNTDGCDYLVRTWREAKRAGKAAGSA